MTGSGNTDGTGIVRKKTGFCFVLLLISFLYVNNLYSQRLKIFNVNTSLFPDVTANFGLYNENGEFIYDLQKEEAEVIENSMQREIVEFYNPSRHLLHISIVMMLDISRSMTGERLQILKEAATYFIDTLPLDITEVAIATFNNNVYLNCDFTQKTTRLRQTIQMIQADGLAGAHIAEIISKAQSENISVYCITVKLRMPYVLKKIAEETGG
ncbi:MAG TPA: VWA domain-containing protein [Bacteroidales bacterium]|nr:VWA domain-containing protein [Bacteroidales bacterium]